MTSKQKFISDIRDRNFNFIGKISEINCSNLKLKNGFNDLIKAYNDGHVKLLLQLQNNVLSKTEIIIEIYKFNNEQKNNLIQLFIMASRAIWQNKADKNEFIQLRSELKNILKLSRKFNQWSLSLLPEESLAGQINSISRTTQEAMTYNDSAALDPNAATDKERIKNGVGIPLPPRLKPESLDPKHRAWGTMSPSIAHSLSPVFNGWVEGDKSEDLTVSIEFNDDLQEIDGQFDPSQKVDEDRAADDKTWFNSMNFYCTKRQSLEYLTTTKDGCLFRGTNANPLDTDKKSFLFVMDMQGNLFINEDGEYRDGKRIGHPSFARGETVACAGEIVIHNGKVTYINNSSGHYQPGGYSLHRVVSELENRGVLDPDCKVQVHRDKNFECKINDQLISSLSVTQFKEVYQKNIQDENIPLINLTEKSNPLALLNCLEKINHYLTKRASETNRVLSLFNSYSGLDYYKRNKNFMSLLSAMKGKSTEDVIKLLSESIPQFQKGRRTIYANLLTDLKTILSTNKNVLSHEVVKETLSINETMYTALRAHEKAHCDYEEKNIFSNKDNEKGEIDGKRLINRTYSSQT